MEFRRKLYTSLEEIQKDLDAHMEGYNWRRTNQGRHCQGRTPMDTFLMDIEKAAERLFQYPEKSQSNDLVEVPAGVSLEPLAGLATAFPSATENYLVDTRD